MKLKSHRAKIGEPLSHKDRAVWRHSRLRFEPPKAHCPSMLEIEDIASNPHKYGAPTYEEFCRGKDWFGRADDGITAISAGPKIGRRLLRKIRYYIRGVELAGEDAVERCLSDFGFTLADIDLKNIGSRLKKEIEWMPIGGDKYDIKVNFLP